MEIFEAVDGLSRGMPFPLDIVMRIGFFLFVSFIAYLACIASCAILNFFTLPAQAWFSRRARLELEESRRLGLVAFVVATLRHEWNGRPLTPPPEPPAGDEKSPPPPNSNPDHKPPLKPETLALTDRTLLEQLLKRLETK
ncbi:hypothetical protein [Zavarzinella formosa]|uniref:hypothetical protein n=1 Tax=Zavarzinella formosa TaxID=360055 RepID=UPI00038077D8|nr:hypothetical protein [Zavarzinella formosa]